MMLPTQALAYSASVLSVLLLFLETCDAKPSSPALNTSSKYDFQNSSLLESAPVVQSQIDVEEPSQQELSEIWTESVEEGERLYTAWAHHTTDRSNAALNNYFEQYVYPYRGRLTYAQKSFLHRFFGSRGPTADRNYFGYDFYGPAAEDAMHPSWEPSGSDRWDPSEIDHVRFLCEVSARDHTILITDWTREEGSDGDMTNGDILWVMWQENVRDERETLTRLKDPDHDLGFVDVARLWSIFYDPVTDPVTLALLNHIMADQNYGAWSMSNMEAPGCDPLGSNVYWALLGSPAGANVMSLLTEHKTALEGIHVQLMVAVRGAERKRVDGSSPEGSPDDDPAGWNQIGLFFSLGKPPRAWDVIDERGGDPAEHDGDDPSVHAGDAPSEDDGREAQLVRVFDAFHRGDDDELARLLGPFYD